MGTQHSLKLQNWTLSIRWFNVIWGHALVESSPFAVHSAAPADWAGICMCVCVCVCMKKERGTTKEKKSKSDNQGSRRISWRFWILTVIPLSKNIFFTVEWIYASSADIWFIFRIRFLFLSFIFHFFFFFCHKLLRFNMTELFCDWKWSYVEGMTVWMHNIVHRCIASKECVHNWVLFLIHKKDVQ